MKIQYGWTKSFVCGVAVIVHFRVQLCTRRFNHYPSMSFSHWVVVVLCDRSDDVVWSPSAPQSWHVAHVLHSMSLFFCHFASCILRREVCVRCEVCFVVVHVRLFWLCFEQIDVFFFFLMKIRCVFARAFGVFWMPTVPSSVA